MIKKGFSILIFTLTGIFLLAHAVIPHHHHNIEVCLVNLPSESHASVHQPHNCNENHDHEANEDDLSCILEKIVVSRSEDSDEGEKFVKLPTSDFASFFVTIFTTSEKNRFYSPEVKKVPPVNSKSTYTIQAPDIFGLRAPPLV